MELERQELIKKAHSLIALISHRPGSTKLLKNVVLVLESYANYKLNRRRTTSK
jgi:hypothetical protein